MNPREPGDKHPLVPMNLDGSKPNAGSRGILTIDFASSFDFEINQISNKDEVYYAQAQRYLNSLEQTQNYVQVTDLRGTSAGWTLKIQQVAQFQATKSTNNSMLNGALISLRAPILVTSGDAVPPTASEVLNLIPGQESIIGYASQGTGAGTWVIRWGDIKDFVEKDVVVQGRKVKMKFSPNVQLHVPGATKKDPVNYRTTLKWILSDLPKN
ncbi:WxL domain-containing protein [Bacillus thuringiensis]|uniref:WxL domain-containing protein n=1 Tax=Bacillus thuringiensis TaxID=1428 RepID=UPI000CD8A508|nr:WxL domain-containing protein [Bacillus thuringiensis]